MIRNIRNKYKLVIFDVDGTLLDTSEGILSAVTYTIEEMGLEMLDNSRLTKFIGPPIQASFATAYGLEGPILQKIAGVFRNRYCTVDLYKAVPYDGVFYVLDEMKKCGITIAAATYKREDYAVSLLKHFGFDQYITVIYGADHENKLKKQDIIEKCIRKSNIIDRNKIIMVGDTEYDAAGASSCGIDFLGVTYGFGFRTRKDMEGVGGIGCADMAKDILDCLVYRTEILQNESKK